MPYTRVDYVPQPFVREPYRSRYGDTIGELLGLSGRRAAELELRRGDSQAQMWQSVGDTIARTIGG